MSDPAYQHLTELLAAVGDGDAGAQEELWSAVYHELRSMARSEMVKHAPGRTIQPTALVHEVWFRLGAKANVRWVNRRHFFGAAARAMRQILVDDARTRNRLKRGGGHTLQRGPAQAAVFDHDPMEVLGVHEALEELEQRDPRKAEIVMLRFFAGLTVQETANAIGLSPRTVELDWRVARAWLHRALSGDQALPGTEPLDD